MRDRIIDALPAVAHQRFLVYLMGPYEAFEIEDMVPEDTDVGDLALPFDEWDSSEGEYDETDVLDLLRWVRDDLRDQADLNAFLAIDVGIDLEEMDAATQSVEFARASNSVIFIAPQVGKNLGVGIETGSVLEALDESEQERVMFVHERGVTSAMLQSLSTRWNVSVRTYQERADLSTQIRQFCLSIMLRETNGDLSKRE